MSVAAQPAGARLRGRVALVTGAGSGIGLACCERFAREGASVAGIDLQGAPAFAEAAGADAPFHVCDVTDAAGLADAVARTLARFGRIDVLVTAAGVADAGPVHLVEESAWDRVLDINLKGTFLSVKAVLPAMMSRRAGSIVTVASIEGLVGSEGGSSYNASKGGVVLLSRNIAMDYVRQGIRCNAICPGFIDTPLLRRTIGAEFLRNYAASVRAETKIGRFGEPAEIAAVALFLASDDASYVNGQAIAVDGGYTAGHAHGLVDLMGLG